jgi:hypothetical protein
MKRGEKELSNEPLAMKNDEGETKKMRKQSSLARDREIGTQGPIWQNK